MYRGCTCVGQMVNIVKVHILLPAQQQHMFDQSEHSMGHIYEIAQLVSMFLVLVKCQISDSRCSLQGTC